MYILRDVTFWVTLVSFFVITAFYHKTVAYEESLGSDDFDEVSKAGVTFYKLFRTYAIALGVGVAYLMIIRFLPFNFWEMLKGFLIRVIIIFNIVQLCRCRTAYIE